MKRSLRFFERRGLGEERRLRFFGKDVRAMELRRVLWGYFEEMKEGDG